MKYKRVLLKLSGESFAKGDGTGINFEKMLQVAEIIKQNTMNGVQIAIVIGGGNFWRGRSNTMMDSCTSDHIGMLATTMNALALNDALLQVGVDSRIQTSVEMRQIAEFYIRDRAIKHLDKNRVVIFGCGTGSPFFSTDTAASLRALEIKADIILKATNVDYIYTKDPRKYSDFEAIKETSHLRVIKDKLKVMDLTAISLCMDNNIPIRIFNVTPLENLQKALAGGEIGTLIK
ncbi:MAG: UMP kinase [Erysipelotrichaceae bacterium]|nr:UMP kinase [Erysipelotrichaceae bacterium]